jgi:rare lipoprotein A
MLNLLMVGRFLPSGHAGLNNPSNRSLDFPGSGGGTNTSAAHCRCGWSLFFLFGAFDMIDLRRCIAAAMLAICAPLWGAPAARAESGHAAYYSGGRTASGEQSGPHGLTAAHRTLPFGTRVLVTNVGNGRSVVVRINDRGPFGRGRIIDVSTAAARELGMIASGTARVTVEQQ